MKDETRETSDKAAPEALAAILREMRAAAKSTDLFNGEEVGEPLIRGSKVEDFADRIEVAAKRELSRAAEDAASKATLDRTAKDAAEYMAYAMARNSAPQSGNAAAMRVALDQCELFLGNVSRHGHPTLNPGDKCTACVDVDELRGMVCRALDAPPRNADRFATVKDAAIAFAREKTDAPQPCPDFNFSAWLLAPATEKEGESNGSK